MPRLTPDSDTLFLFDMEDFNLGTFEILQDEAGNDNLLLTGSAYFVTGPGTLDSVRALEAQEAKKFNVSNTLLTASWGNNTVEAWLWPNPGHGDIFLFNGPRGSGESIATNFTLRLRLDSSNLWQMFYEYDNGTNMTFLQSTSNITNGQWNHVGIVRRATGSNVAADFYCNGVLDETVELAGELPNSGSGTDEQDLSINWDGFITSVRFSNIARSGSEISSSAMRTDYTHTTDANTISHWKMQELPTIQNKGIAPHHLTIIDGNVQQYPPITSDTTGSLFFYNAVCQTTNLSYDQVATDITGSEYTIDFWCKLLYDDPNQYFCTSWSSGETLETNFLFRHRFDAISKNFKYFSERDAGIDVIYETTASLTGLNKFESKYIAFVHRKDFNNDEIYLDFYVNGDLLETSSGSALLNIANGGTSNRLACPGDNSGGNTYANMQQFRLLKRALTSEEISNNYISGSTYTETAGVTILDLYRALSGSQYVYYTSADPQPEGAMFITKIGTVES